MLKNQVRKQIETHLTQTCRIERYTYGSGSLGGRTKTGTQVITTACFLTRVQRTGADMVAAAEQGRIYHMLHVPWDVDIQDQDVVFLILDKGDEVKFETAQVLRYQSVEVMRQALVVKAGS